MKNKDLLKLIEPYCDRIIHGSRHYKAYVKGTNKVITISNTSTDWNRHYAVSRDFRRLGINIKI